MRTVTDTQTAKRPWVAAVLSVVFPGLGHVYLREWLRTALWISLIFLTVSLLIPPDFVPQEFTYDAMIEATRNLPAEVSGAILVLRTLNVVDAYVIARRGNQRQEVANGSQCPACGHDLDDPTLEFCPWCAAELSGEHDEGTDSRFGL